MFSLTESSASTSSLVAAAFLLFPPSCLPAGLAVFVFFGGPETWHDTGTISIVDIGDRGIWMVFKTMGISLKSILLKLNLHSGTNHMLKDKMILLIKVWLIKSADQVLKNAKLLLISAKTWFTSYQAAIQYQINTIWASKYRFRTFAGACFWGLAGASGAGCRFEVFSFSVPPFFPAVSSILSALSFIWRNNMTEEAIKHSHVVEARQIRGEIAGKNVFGGRRSFGSWQWWNEVLF